MQHYHLDSNDTDGDHYAVMRSGLSAKVVAQLQSDGQRIRIALEPARARHFAQLLLAEADKVEGVDQQRAPQRPGEPFS